MLKKLRITTQNPDGEKTLLFEGITHTDGKRIRCKEATSRADLCIDLYEDGLYIHRLAHDIETRLTLRQSETDGEIKGEVGTFELTDLQFLDYQRDSGNIRLRYDLGGTYIVYINELGVTNNECQLNEH